MAKMSTSAAHTTTTSTSAISGKRTCIAVLSGSRLRLIDHGLLGQGGSNAFGIDELEDARLQPAEDRAGEDGHRPWPRDRHLKHLADAAGAGRHHHDAVRQKDRLVDVVGDEDDGPALLGP